MSKRNRREHGRIISVETLTRGDSLAADVAAGATSITVNDAGDFDEDGGWLYIGAQTVEYTACDDDTGIITLATALTAVGEQGDPVQVWSDVYDEVVDYQLALVELDGEYDNPDPVAAEVAEGVGDLPEGDRGKAGESCTLERVADDEWEVVGVGGRPRKSRALRFEQDDRYALAAADITAGSVVMSLSHTPAKEALTCVLAGVPQPPTEWTINYDAQTLTVPLGGWEEAGDVLWVHYAYRKGLRPKLRIPLGSVWKYANNIGSSSTIAAVGYDDSGWASGPSGFGHGVYTTIGATVGTVVGSGGNLDVWTRVHGFSNGGDLQIHAYRVDFDYWVYVDGTLVASGNPSPAGDLADTVVATVPASAGEHVIAVRVLDTAGPGNNGSVSAFEVFEQ